jgi:hypothetical protein
MTKFGVDNGGSEAFSCDENTTGSEVFIRGQRHNGLAQCQPKDAQKEGTGLQFVDFDRPRLKFGEIGGTTVTTRSEAANRWGATGI